MIKSNQQQSFSGLSDRLVTGICDLTYTNTDFNYYSKEDIKVPTNMSQLVIELENKVFENFLLEDIFKLINLYKECVEFYGTKDEEIERFYLNKIQELCLMKQVAKQFNNQHKVLNKTVYEEDETENIEHILHRPHRKSKYNKLRKRASIMFNTKKFKLNDVELAVKLIRRQQLTLFKNLRKARMIVQEEERRQMENFHKQRAYKIMKKAKGTMMVTSKKKDKVSD